MTKKHRICVFTSTRADYGLLYWTLVALRDSSRFDLAILASGTHLSPEFGATITEVESDGFNVTQKVEMLLSADTPVGVSKSLGLGVLGYAQALHDINPDILLVLGDRFEAFAVAAAATVQRIPIAHCHGGETTEGAIDEAFRHGITKMSHLHFVSTQQYRKRVIQLGEHPSKVHLVGALGLENIDRAPLMSREELQASLGWPLDTRYLVITFHPVTLEHQTALEQVGELLAALDRLQDTRLLFTLPNADTDGRAIIAALKAYADKNHHKAVCFESLGRLRYLSAVRHCVGVVGNSSSGILEVPSLGKGTVNIGDRQKGRIAATSVIHCEPHKDDITVALNKLLSPGFQQKAKIVVNPYWHGRASEKIVAVLEDLSYDQILKKQFYDVDYEVFPA